MKNNNKIWKAEPWDDSITANLPRPSEKTRSSIYAMAKEFSVANNTPAKAKSFLNYFRVSYLLWSSAAIILIAACIWFGNTGKNMSNSSIYAKNDINNLTEDIISIMNVEKIYPITETNGTDSDDIFLIVELQTINESLAGIENNLQLSL